LFKRFDDRPHPTEAIIIRGCWISLWCSRPQDEPRANQRDANDDQSYTQSKSSHVAMKKRILPRFGAGGT